MKLPLEVADAERSHIRPLWAVYCADVLQPVSERVWFSDRPIVTPSRLRTVS